MAVMRLVVIRRLPTADGSRPLHPVEDKEAGSEDIFVEQKQNFGQGSGGDTKNYKIAYERNYAWASTYVLFVEPGEFQTTISKRMTQID